MRMFNVTGLCVPEKHYMVDISEKLAKIMVMIDRGDYFTINRARQYGKTTTLLMLARKMPPEYTCISLSFEGVGDTMFASSASFCQSLLLHISKALESTDRDYASQWLDEMVTDFDLLGYHIEKLCKGKKIVLMVDEVDKTSNNQVFLHFLGMLRSKYLSRQAGAADTFHNVILAGVYDIKNKKLKMANDGFLDCNTAGERLYNSPWNIAADFEIDMSFSPSEIVSMLDDYETEHKTGMAIQQIADEIYNYTGGYPYLVSRICKHMDEKLEKTWTQYGLQQAAQIMLQEKSTLSDDIIKNLENSLELYDFIYSILIEGDAKRYVIHDPIIDAGVRYGYFSNIEGRIAVSNRIFEMIMTAYFVSKGLRSNKRVNGVLQRDIVHDGRFNMELCLSKFAEHYTEIFSNDSVEFLEKHGRLIFLTYLAPLINGEGFYHIESQFTDLRRMDLVVDYGRDQFIIELKLWKGESEHSKSYEQLCGYLEHKNASTGYLLTFDFRKNKSKTPQSKWVDVGDKRIFDIMV